MIVDLSSHLPAFREAVVKAIMQSDPVDLHGLRNDAIRTELDYHLDNLFVCLQKKDEALMAMVKYKVEVSRECKDDCEPGSIADLVSKMGLYLYEYLVSVKGYIDDSYFPYLYYGMIGYDAVILFRNDDFAKEKS
jgi:hypothetical protein